MSSFYCEYCGKEIIDTPQPRGYITGCKHYPFVNPLDRTAVNRGSTSTCQANKVHTPFPKQEDWRAFVRLCSDLSRLQADSDKVKADLDQAGRKPVSQRSRERDALLPSQYRNRQDRVLRKAKKSAFTSPLDKG